MGASSVVLTVEEGHTEGMYSFVCPQCAETVEKRADRKVVMLLLSAGVEVQETPRFDIPLGHPSMQPARDDLEGPPFTADDLIDFHFLLEQGDWLEQLLKADA
ncbi:MAG TPA: hypothetical protein VGB51_04955 [Actinomycetota bacterium]